jgi:hypothetical protein
LLTASSLQEVNSRGSRTPPVLFTSISWTNTCHKDGA